MRTSWYEVISMTIFKTLEGKKLKKAKVSWKHQDGNAFAVIGSAISAMRKAGYPKKVIDRFKRRATSGDYGHVLETVGKYCDTT